MTFLLRFCLASLVALIVSVNSSGQNVSSDVVKVANFAIREHNRISNYVYAFKIVDIISDSSQILPPVWVKYFVEVNVAQTVCRNNGNVNLEDCSLMANAQIITCKFVVMAVPGQNTVPKTLLSQQCT